MALEKAGVLDSRFQADLVVTALEEEGIPHLVRTYTDTAYDGLFVSQKGYASLLVEPEHLERAREILAEVGQARAETTPEAAELAQALDHTLLDPEADLEALTEHAAQCRLMACAAACVSPWMVPHAAALLEGSGVAVCTVVGFPLGTESTAEKIAATETLVAAGAGEIDMVLNRGLVRSGLLAEAVDEVRAVVAAAGPALVKVILETSRLGSQETHRVAAALKDAGAAMLKTGSGYFGPATADDVRILRAAAPGLGVKAAGGIATWDQARALLWAGAERLGASKGFDIWREAGGWPAD